MESSDGTQRIAPREIFEDVYVAMGPAIEKEWPLPNTGNLPISDMKRRTSDELRCWRERPGIVSDLRHGKIEQWQIRGGTEASCHLNFYPSLLWKTGAQGKDPTC